MKKGTTLWHLEEVVEQSFDCPHCGGQYHFNTDDVWHEVDEEITCKFCGEIFVLVDEDWRTA